MPSYLDIISFISGALAVHGILLSSYLFFGNKSQSGKKWLALLILSLSVILAEYAIYAPQHNFPSWFIAIKIPFFYLLGPFFYFTIRPKHVVKPIDLLHFLPFALCILLLLPFYFEDSNLKVVIADADIGQWKRTGYFVFNVIQLIGYSISGLRLLSQDSKTTRNTRLVTYTFASLTAIYLIGLALFISQEISTLRTLFSIALGLTMNTLAYGALRDDKLAKGVSLNMDKNMAGAMAAKIETHLKLTKPYLNADYRIQDLSDAISSNPTYTSHVINQYMNTTYSDLINQHRIAEAKLQLASSEENKKIFAVALDSGFNNKTNFIRVFKKITGLSPTDYRKKHQLSGNN
jgi:AraC-like DNA-binding protein